LSSNNTVCKSGAVDSDTMTLSSSTAWVVGTPINTVSPTNSNSGGSTDSLADVAMYYFNTDLRTAALNNCTSPLTGADVCANNVSSTDKNTQQHMTTFTLGLGVNGVLNYSSTYETDTSGDFFDIKTGSKDWPVPTANDPTTTDDLWHAAVDGHGAYFSAKNPASLASSLSKVLATIDAKLGFGTAAATSSLEPVNGNNAIYVASYTSADWTGSLKALTVDPSTGAISTTPDWCVENIAADPIKGIPACTGTFKFLGEFIHGFPQH